VLGPTLLQGAVLGLTAAGSPGAFQAYLIHQSLQGGWRRGALVALGPLISDPPIVITILFLLDNLPAGYLRWIGLLGGFFALYMAWSLWRSARRTPVSPTEPVTYPTFSMESQDAWGVIARAALMNFLSPGPYLFWSLVVGPLLLDAWRTAPIHGLAFLVGFYTAFIGFMLALAAIFAQARRLGPRMVGLLARLSLIILAAFGLYLIWQTLGVSSMQ
jgi:threonine/homoserine/homoserine lactone efflux protein